MAYDQADFFPKEGKSVMRGEDRGYRHFIPAPRLSTESKYL